MFAAPVAKSQAKTPACPTTGLRPSALIARRPDHGAFEERRLLRQSVGDEAALRTHPDTSLREQHNRQGLVDSPDPAAQAPLDNSWSLRSISIFPPDQARRRKVSIFSGREERSHGASLVQSPRVPDLVQAKLRIGALDDPLEREADRIADQIVRAPVLGPSSGLPQVTKTAGGTQLLQTDRTSSSQPAGGRAAAVDHAIGSPGQRLDASVRADFEPRFGHDFGAVRVHCDATAGASADGLNARAYTVGRDIVFAPGTYRPWSAEGRRLLAHELAHVMQQEGQPPLVQRQPAGSVQRADEPDEPLEQALERQQWFDELAEKNKKMEQELGPIMERLAEQLEAQDPFFVRENPNLVRLKAQLQDEKKRLPGELADADKELTKASKEFLKADDKLAELEDLERLLAEERELFGKRLAPILASVQDMIENDVKTRKDAAAKEVQEKRTSIEAIKQYMADKKAYIWERDHFIQQMREQLKFQGLGAARRAGVSTETPLSGQPAALAQTATLLQTLIEASRLLDPYVSGKRNINLRLPGHFRVDDPAAFEAAKKAAHIGATERGTDVGGFYDRQHDTIHLPQTAHFGEALHEAIHNYSAVTMRNLCTKMNEGVTQILADEVLREQGLPKVERVKYEKEVDCATKLIRQFGFDAVASFYFLGEYRGQVRGLFEAVKSCDDYC